MPSQDPKKPEGRKRDIRLWWERNTDGPIITRSINPPGLRTPEGYVWGHKINHIFWIPRIPGVNAVAIWSRSMLKEFGEGYDEVEWDEPLVAPRVLRPWPVLKLLEGHAQSGNPPIGAIDGGCECEHAEQVSYRIRESDPSEYPAPVADQGVPCHAPKTEEKATEESTKAAPTEDVDVQMADASAEDRDGGANPADVARPSAATPKEATGDSLQAEESKENDSTDDAAANKDDATAADAADAKSEEYKEPPPLGPQYSVAGLPKLEEFIPEKYFPDVLMVHDPQNATHQPKEVLEREGGLSKPIKYIRLFPEFARDRGEADASDDARVAHLHFSKANRFGMGNHSYVYRTPLTLPPPLSAHSHDGRVTVAAKLAYSRCSAHNLLRNEGRVYGAFPKHIQQEYCGYNIVPQCRFPVPATAIVPKFYGYYVPVDERGNVQDHHHDRCSEADPCNVDWPSPILLMEECGNPVEPSKFTIDQRTECFSLIQRLHYMDLTQGSFYVRNIMIQPGPLTVPPAERSYDTPSFRIIDFGRGDDWKTYSRRRYSGGKNWHEWQAILGDEIARARNELLIDDFGF